MAEVTLEETVGFKTLRVPRTTIPPPIFFRGDKKLSVVGGSILVAFWIDDEVKLYLDRHNRTREDLLKCVKPPGSSHFN